MPRYIVRHHGGLKYVRAIPKKLWPLEGRKVWTEYLGQISIEDAKTRALELAAEHDKRAKVLRNLTAVEKRLLASRGGIARCEADASQAEYLEAVLFPYTFNRKRGERTKSTIVALREAHAPIHNVLARLNGDPAATNPRLFDLIDLHQRAKPGLTPKVLERERTYVRRFAEVAGDHAAPDVTRDHIINFRDHLEANGLKQDNVGQHIAKLHTLFALALSEGVVTSNPADGVKARVQAGTKFVDEEGEPFTASHVERIFAGLPGEKEGFQWIIRLLAYHGARSGEICQLKCSDVTTLHGVPVLRIHDKYGRVKNRQSVRDVPIHPKCKGIIAYAAKVTNAQGPGSWLFPSLRDSKAGRAHGFQNYANGKFLRTKIGISDRQPGARQYDHTIHSFRHLFSTLCREVGMPDSVKYSLMGHSLGKGEGGKYGEGPSLKVRAKWIAKIDPLKG